MKALRTLAETSPGRAYFARVLVLSASALRGAGRSADTKSPSGSGVRVRLLASPSSCPVLVMLMAPLRATLPQPLSRACSPAAWRLRCSGVRGAGSRGPLDREYDVRVDPLRGPPRFEVAESLDFR